MAKYEIVLNCHPNERVAEEMGKRVARELRKRGHQATIIRMPDMVTTIEGRIPW